MIKEIESDSRFMIKLDFVLSKYVNYPLDNAIKKASKNLSKIKDVDTWVNDIKEGKL